MNSKRDAELRAEEIANAGRQPETAGVLEAHHGERHVVVFQNFPDPDAIFSASAHQIINACEAREHLEPEFTDIRRTGPTAII
jgi:hypothetical protein